jgi:hypothetical protein
MIFDKKKIFKFFNLSYLMCNEKYYSFKIKYNRFYSKFTHNPNRTNVCLKYLPLS